MRITDLPRVLTWSRVFLGLGLVITAVSELPARGPVCAGLVVAGLLTDVFDGVAARRLKVSTEGLRRLDSRVDVLFFLCVLAGQVLLSPGLLSPLAVLLGTLGVLEVSVHVLSFLRFRKESSTHHYLSKAFAVLLFGLMVQLSLVPVVTWFFWVVLGFGVLSYLEAALIMATVPRWRCDVRSYWDVVRERKAPPTPGSPPTGT